MGIDTRRCKQHAVFADPYVQSDTGMIACTLRVFSQKIDPYV